MKSRSKTADQYFNDKNYQGALKLYQDRKKGDVSTGLRIAECLYFLRCYDDAIAQYDRLIRNGTRLPATDLYYYAEANTCEKNYERAVTAYQDYLAEKRNDPVVLRKIWRLTNIGYLLEDSLSYALRPLTLNSAEMEMYAVPYLDGIVFLSNPKETQIVERIDASTDQPFFKLLFSKIVSDTSLAGAFVFQKPVRFAKTLNCKFHEGRVTFFDRFHKMIFAASSLREGSGGKRTLQLFFAEVKEGKWQVEKEFPFNNPEYSLTDPFITEDGSTLYFASDMAGGFGGKDLYKSTWVDGEWTKPINLGDEINTVFDECGPFLQSNNTLYFSSNGHPGMGGLDIFKVRMTHNGFDEVLNAGYPLNSNHDEFGIFIDSLSVHGYLTSNRGKKGKDDDLYEFDIDLQSYPLTISGTIRYREHNLDDSSTLNAYANAKMILIDNIRNVTVFESKTDNDGDFSIIVPYFTKYRIKVVGEDGEESVVSLDIPRQRKLQSSYEIVIVKDAFKVQETR